jgi:predicted Holliday junction resolvase-like endonuclease
MFRARPLQAGTQWRVFLGSIAADFVEVTMQNLLIVIGVLAVAALLFAAYRFVELRANLRFERWKAAHSHAISREAIRGSQAAVAGRVFERFAPYLPDFNYNPKDVRFLGDPVDFVVFDGLSEGNVRKVVFVEVKTGHADLNGSERRVKGAVVERRVEWALYRVPNGQPQLPHSETGLSADGSSSSLDTVLQHLPPSLRSGSATIRDRGRF